MLRGGPGAGNGWAVGEAPKALLSLSCPSRHGTVTDFVTEAQLMHLQNPATSDCPVNPVTLLLILFNFCSCLLQGPD